MASCDPINGVVADCNRLQGERKLNEKNIANKTIK